MLNNLFYYVNNFCIEICIDVCCLYMQSIIVLRKKIGIGKIDIGRSHFHKSESAKKIAIGASLISEKQQFIFL